MRKRTMIAIAVVVLGLVAAAPARAQTLKTNVVLGSSVAEGFYASGAFNGPDHEWVDLEFVCMAVDADTGDKRLVGHERVGIGRRYLQRN